MDTVVINIIISHPLNAYSTKKIVQGEKYDFISTPAIFFPPVHPLLKWNRSNSCYGLQGKKYRHREANIIYLPPVRFMYSF
jgi:hypothetical protein